jgi:hypothetical protein
VTAEDAMREAARRHARALKGLAGTPDPTAWVEPAAVQAVREVADETARAEERAAIVAWLRHQSDRRLDQILAGFLRSFADAVARGEHHE